MLHQVKAQGLNPLKMGNLLRLKDHLTNKMSLVLRNGRLRLLQDQIPLEQHLQEKKLDLDLLQKEENLLGRDAKHAVSQILHPSQGRLLHQELLLKLIQSTAGIRRRLLVHLHLDCNRKTFEAIRPQRPLKSLQGIKDLTQMPIQKHLNLVFLKVQLISGMMLLRVIMSNPTSYHLH